MSTDPGPAAAFAPGRWAGGGARGRYADLEAAARDVVLVLGRHLPFDLWMVIRLDGAEATVVVADDHGYGVAEGERVPLAAAVCAALPTDRGAVVVGGGEDSARPAAAGLNGRTVAAFAAAPLVAADGSVSGAICGVHPEPVVPAGAGDEALLAVQARLLSSLLPAEGGRPVLHDHHDGVGHIDPLTGVVDARAWEALVRAEEDRSRRYGCRASVVSVEVAGVADMVAGAVAAAARVEAPGPALIDEAVEVMVAEARGSDLVARLGPTSAAVLVVESTIEGGRRLAERLTRGFQAQGLAPSLTVSVADAFTALPLAPAGPVPTGGATSGRREPSAMAVVNYAVCGNCHRKGAYVSPRTSLLRCKYCRAKQVLSSEQWQRPEATLALLAGDLGREGPPGSGPR